MDPFAKTQNNEFVMTSIPDITVTGGLKIKLVKELLNDVHYLEHI